MADVLDDLFGDDEGDATCVPTNGTAATTTTADREDEASRNNCGVTSTTSQACSSTLASAFAGTVTMTATSLLEDGVKALLRLLQRHDEGSHGAAFDPAFMAALIEFVDSATLLRRQVDEARSMGRKADSVADAACCVNLHATSSLVLSLIKVSLQGRRSWPDDVTRKAFEVAHLAGVVAPLFAPMALLPFPDEPPVLAPRSMMGAAAINQQHHDGGRLVLADAAASVIRHADMAFVAAGDAALQPIIAAAMEHLPVSYPTRCLAILAAGGAADAESAAKVFSSLASGSKTISSARVVRTPDRTGDPGYIGPIDVYAHSVEDLDVFKSDVYARARPVVLPASCGLTRGWTALSEWADLLGLVEAHGMRTVPVEIGRHSLGTWREETMLLSEFVARFILASALRVEGKMTNRKDGEPRYDAPSFEAAMAVPSEHIGYIAQHPLFDHIPALKRAFRPPAVLCKHCNDGGGIRRVNAWFGTDSTVTPLHFDSYDNFLVQVVGYKLVRLYDPQQTRFLHAADGGRDGDGDATLAQGNISPVSVESYDSDPRQQAAFPSFAAARYTETVLGPGEALFMPRGVWHYVRSLTPSISVNFWF